MSTSLSIRARQGVAHFRSGQGDITLRAQLWAYARPGIEPHWARLGCQDQRHLIEVAIALRNRGCTFDVIAAGLLHDLGRGIPNKSIRPLPRALHVILGRLSPSILQRIGARQRRVAVLREIWTLIHHAQLGAEICESLGYSGNVCRLVAAHHHSHSLDPEVLIIQGIDHHT